MWNSTPNDFPSSPTPRGGSIPRANCHCLSSFSSENRLSSTGKNWFDLIVHVLKFPKRLTVSYTLSAQLKQSNLPWLFPVPIATYDQTAHSSNYCRYAYLHEHIPWLIRHRRTGHGLLIAKLKKKERKFLWEYIKFFWSFRFISLLIRQILLQTNKFSRTWFTLMSWRNVSRYY